MIPSRGTGLRLTLLRNRAPLLLEQLANKATHIIHVLYSILRNTDVSLIRQSSCKIDLLISGRVLNKLLRGKGWRKHVWFLKAASQSRTLASDQASGSMATRVEGN